MRVGAAPIEKPHDRLDKLGHFGAEAHITLEIVFVGDAIEIPAKLLLGLVFGSLSRLCSPSLQVTLCFVGKWSAFEIRVPDVAKPDGFLRAALPIEKVAHVYGGFVDPVHVGIVVARDAQRLQVRIPRLVAKLAGNPEFGKKLVAHRRASARQTEIVRALGSDQALAVDDELILAAFAAENRMVLKHQALLRPATFFRDEVGGAKAGKAATNDDHVVGFARIGAVRQRIVAGVANLVCGAHHGPGVAVGVGVIADAAIACPSVAARLGLGPAVVLRCTQ